MLAKRLLLVFFFAICTLTFSESRRRNSKIFELPNGIAGNQETEEDAKEVTRDRKGKRKILKMSFTHVRVRYSSNHSM